MLMHCMIPPEFVISSFHHSKDRHETLTKTLAARNFSLRLSADIRNGFEEQGLTVYEAVTLASMVEREAVQEEEQPLIASVYLNRFRIGMKLDADPTVIYALKKISGNFDTIIKRVLYKDLTIDSPYNTYLYKELPPGPIAMPDISSIDAVLNYEDHDYFFFVADATSTDPAPQRQTNPDLPQAANRSALQQSYP